MSDIPFWSDPYQGEILHFPTLRDKMRKDLSANAAPITYEQVRAIAVDELGVPYEATLFHDDEVSRPLLWLVTAWAWRTCEGISREDAKAFGTFIAEAAGDAAFGPITGPKEEAAWNLIRQWPHVQTPDQTLLVLARITRIFFGRGHAK